MTTAEATRELRKHIGESQQAFATRLGLSMSAIANYEQGRAPTGRALVALSRTAMEYGRMDLHQIFAEAVISEIQVARDSLHYGYRRHDDGAKSAYLLMDVDGRERMEAVAAFAHAMNLTFAKDAKQSSAATKLLGEFTRRAAKEFGEPL